MTGIRVQTDDFGVRRVAAVETEHGSIQTPCVVNCAGGNGFLSAPECWCWLLPSPGLSQCGESLPGQTDLQRCPMPSQLAAPTRCQQS